MSLAFSSCATSAAGTPASPTVPSAYAGPSLTAMVMSLVASLRGVSLVPAYLQALMPWSVVSRPLAGEVPTIDLVVGYRKKNESPVLKAFLARAQELIGLASPAERNNAMMVRP